MEQISDKWYQFFPICYPVLDYIEQQQDLKFFIFFQTLLQSQLIGEDINYLRIQFLKNLKRSKNEVSCELNFVVVDSLFCVKTVSCLALLILIFNIIPSIKIELTKKCFYRTWRFQLDMVFL